MHRRLRQFAAFIAGLMLTLVVLVGPWTAAAQGQEAAHQQFLFAYKLLQRSEDAQAIRAFDEFLEKYPQDEKRADALYYRALLSQRAGDNEKAAALMREVGDPQHVPVYAVQLLRGQVHTALNQFDHALAALEAIKVADLPDDALRASLYQLRGGAYRAMGNYDAAIEALRGASQIDSPLKGQSLLDLGRIYAWRGESQNAVDALQKALDVGDPAVAAEAARLAADQSYALKRYDDAVAYYAIVITAHQTSPHFSPSVLGMMWAMLSARQYDLVLQTFEQYRPALSPTDGVTAAYLAGSALQELGLHQRAIETLTAVAPNAKSSQYHAQLLYKIAVSQFEIQQYEAMSQSLRSLFDEHPESPLNVDGQFLLAATEARRGHADEGIARLTAIIERQPPHPYQDQALLQRAELLEQADKLEEAVGDYVRYLALPGKIDEQGLFLDHDPVLRVCDLYFKSGRYDEALKTLDRLLASHPDADVEAEALYRSAHARIKLNQHAQAVAALSDLIDRHPQSPLVWQARYYRGLLRVGMGHSQPGLDDLTLASAAPDLPQALRANALRLSAVAQRELDDPVPAVETLMKLRQLSGLTADEMLWLGRYFSETGQTPSAVAYLEPLTDPARTVPAAIRAEALFILGGSYRQSGATDKAIAALERLLREDPGSEPQARLALAQTLRDAGRIDEALEHYARLSSSAVSRIAAESLFDAGQIYRERAVQLRRSDDAAGASSARVQAFDHFKRLVVLYAFAELSPMPELSLIHLSELATEQGDSGASLSSLAELVEKFPQGPYAIYARAAIAGAQGKRSEAEFLVNRLREGLDALDPQLAQRVTALQSQLEVAP